MTSYVILRRREFFVPGEEPSPWFEDVDRQEAHNAFDAIKAAYMKRPDDSIVMCAVAAKSFKQTPIRSEPQPPKIVLGEQHSVKAPPA